MIRTNQLLLLLVLAEIAVGGFLTVQRLTRPAPPEADWALLDPDTADQVRTAAACASAEDWRKLGELYMAAGCFSESEICHRVACRLDPSDARMARQWAFALERLALLDDANAQYRRAAELRPADADACRYFIARNLLRAERPDEARAVFAEGKPLAANRYELARLHLRAGEFRQAAELLEPLTAPRPGSLQPLQLAYRLALERGDDRAAFALADRARYAPNRLLNPFDDEAERIVRVTQALGPARHWAKGRELIEAGRLDDAEAMLREAGRRHWSGAINELLAEVAARQGRHSAAVRLFEQFQADNGPSARIIARIGDVWEAAGQPAKARAAWQHAVQLGTGLDLRATHLKLARACEAAGNGPAARRHTALAQYFAGLGQLHAGQPHPAEASFAAAVEGDAKLTQAWFYLGEARRLLGQDGPAETAYQTCLTLNPDHGRAIANLEFLRAGKAK